MADHNTRIVFSAADNGTEDLISRLRRSSHELAEEMIRDAREQGQIGKDMTRMIEDQIRAIERKNSITRQQGVTQLGAQLASGVIDKDEYNQQKSTLSQEYDEDSLQTKLLRELIETIKEESKDELRRDRDNVEKQITALTTGALGDDVDDRDYFRISYQSELVQEKQDEDNQRKSFSNLAEDYGGGAVNQIARAGISKNEVYAVAALVSALPVVGGAISGLISKSFGQAEELQQSMGALRSMSMDSVPMMGGGAAAYGVSMSQFMSGYATPFARQRGFFGQSSDVQQGGEDLLGLEKGLGIDSQSILQSVKLTRNADTQSPVEIVGQLTKDLFDSGVLDFGDFTAVPEYLQLMNSLMSQQVQRLDSIDVGINTSVISALAEVGGGFSDPAVLGGIINAIDGSLRQPSTQYAQAMQFSVMSRINPNASRFELMEMQEKGVQDPRVMTGLLEQLSTAAGGDQDLFLEQIKAMFPQLSYAQTRRLGSSFSRGELNFTEGEDVDPEAMRELLSSRASQTTGYLQRETVEINNILAQKGDELSRGVGQMVNSLGGIEGAVSGLMDVGIGIVDGMNKLFTMVGGSPISSGHRTNNPFTPNE